MPGSTLAALALLAPALAFAAMATLLRDVPADWGASALIAWTAVATALLGGAALQTGPLPWLAGLGGFAALMAGGPPGLAAAALAAGLLAFVETPAPRWLPLALSGLALAAAVRRGLG